MIDVEALKNKILDLAISGKLTEQLESDGNAEDLYIEIQKEKEKLVKEGKIKKEKELAEVCDNEVPFEIPKNWKWVKLGEITDIERGGSPRPIKSFITESENGVNWIKIGDVAKDGKYIENAKEKIKPEGVKRSRKVYPGDFLLTNSMSFGRPYICNIEGCVHDGWLIIRNKYKLFDIEFLYYLLSSKYAYNQFCIKATGSTVENLNIDKVTVAMIPLLPIKEQKRIVDKIKVLYDVLEVINKSQNKYQNDYIIFKSKIIEAGISGKLTKQLAGDGNAEDLYKEIQKEKEKLIKEGKIKKEKELPEITDDEIPFEIPKNWKWCRLNELIYNVGTKENQILSKSILKSGKFPVISQGQEFIDGYTNDESKVIKNDAVVMFGDHTRNVKYIDFDFVIGADGTKFIKPIIANVKYVYYWTLIAANNMYSRGYARHYSILKNEAFPLPPMKEQERIVAKIDELLREVR